VNGAFPSALTLAAAIVVASVAATSPSRAQEGPGFGNKTLHTSDVQYRFTRSPDNKALSVLFDNFSVNLVSGGGPAPAIRVLPLRIPVSNAGKGATLRVQARGGLVCSAGATCLAILWLNGQTKVLNLAKDKSAANYYAEAEFSLPGAEVYQAAIMLIAEREAKRKRLLQRNEVTAMLGVDSLDFTIAPPAPAAGTKKQ
jgi:hypothetical protein